MSVTARRGVRGPSRRARAEARTASRLLATVVSVAGLVVAACGAQTSGGDHQTRRPSGAVILNTTTVGELVVAFTDAGLAVPNAHDVGPQKCPQIGCIDAVDTDTVSIMKFPSTGKAELYAASIPRMFLVEDVVVVFSSAVSPEARRAYEQGGETRCPLSMSPPLLCLGGSGLRRAVRISVQIAMMAAWPSVIATSPADPEVRARATPLAGATPP